MRDSVIYQDIKAQGWAEGRQEGEILLILRQINRRLGQISPPVEEQIRNLSVAQLEDLAEALLDFTSESDLLTWLKR